MSLYLKQDEGRSQLQEKIAKELQERAKRTTAEEELPDGVLDSAYLKDTKTTTSLAWVWVIIGVAVVCIVVWLLIASA